jgi:L-malate glycosyltransferase
LKILLAVETLHPGGAEMFALRLAAALSQNHEVVLLRFYKEAADQAWIDKYPASFTHAWPEIRFDKFWRRMDRVLRLLNIDFSFRERKVKRSLNNLIANFRPDVIHSNQIKVDYIMAQVKTSQAFVITLHGDYKTFDELKDPTRRILNFNSKLNLIESKKPAFAYLSETQREYLTLKGIGSNRLVKIYNGYFADAPQAKKDNSVFTFGMIARGIPEKGWQIAIDAFITVHQQFPDTQLLLIGDSPYMQTLKTAYENEPAIRFVGQSSDPLHWISQMHVGLLPSYYSSESLPTSVIEYLQAKLK